MAVVYKYRKLKKFSIGAANLLQTLVLLCLYVGTMTILASCGNDTNYRDYYFPEMEEDEEKIIVYKSIGPVETFQFWKVRKVADTYHIKVYDQKGIVLQESHERITEEGILHVDGRIEWRDTTTGEAILIDQEIVEPDLFPFNPLDSHYTYIHKTEWSYGNKKFGLTRNRRFLGLENFTMNSNKTECMRFLCTEMYTDEEEGYLDVVTSGYEYYAKGYGLVLKQRWISKNFVVGIQQLDIYSPAEFETAFPAIDLESTN